MGTTTTPMQLPPPDSFLPYEVPVPSRRPASVLALGIIGIVLASLTLLGGLVGLAFLILFQWFGPGMGVIFGTPAERTWQVVQMIASWGFYSVLLWVSIAAIRLRPWARGGMVRWAGAYLSWLAVETCVVALWILPADAASAANAGGPATPFLDWGAYAVLAITVLLSSVYPIAVIVFMRKPHVRAAFRPASSSSLPTGSESPGGQAIPLAGLAPAGAPAGDELRPLPMAKGEP